MNSRLGFFPKGFLDFGRNNFCFCILVVRLLPVLGLARVRILVCVTGGACKGGVVLRGRISKSVALVIAPKCISGGGITSHSCMGVVRLCAGSDKPKASCRFMIVVLPIKECILLLISLLCSNMYLHDDPTSWVVKRMVVLTIRASIIVMGRLFLPSPVK